MMTKQFTSWKYTRPTEEESKENVRFDSFQVPYPKLKKNPTTNKTKYRGLF